MAAGVKHMSKVEMLLVLLAFALLVVPGCVPQADQRGCSSAQAELENLKAELQTTRTELEKARNDLATAKAATLEELLRQRRSVREYSEEPLTKEEVMKLLWAGQGITKPPRYRTAPSAGALYPLELYVVVGNVTGLEPGVYKYDPVQNNVRLVKGGDVRQALAIAALAQSWVGEGAIDIVIAAVYDRTKVKYGERGERYVHMEVGHAAQNICLQATALGLGLVTVGAFDDSSVAKVVGLAGDETPLYVIPVGRTK
jgi:SagB-type dehydrogenase family enzyme